MTHWSERERERYTGREEIDERIREGDKREDLEDLVFCVMSELSE